MLAHPRKEVAAVELAAGTCALHRKGAPVDEVGIRPRRRHRLLLRRRHSTQVRVQSPMLRIEARAGAVDVRECPVLRTDARGAASKGGRVWTTRIGTHRAALDLEVRELAPACRHSE